MRRTNSASKSHWHLCDIHATLSQPISPFHGNPPFDTGNVICPMGGSPNLETSFKLSLPCTSRSSIPHPTHFRSVLQTTITPNQVVLHTYTQHTHTHTHTHTHARTQKGYTKASPQFFAQGPLNAPSHVSTFKQSAVTLLHKRTSRYLIWHKCIIL